MKNRVKALVLIAPGTNCDGETIFAIEAAGGVGDPVPVEALIQGHRKLIDYQIMIIPGGFSYGDDISAGLVLANKLKMGLGAEIPAFVKRGGLVLGVCNGFQVLVKMGVLPGFRSEGKQPLSLTGNDSGRFECRWVHLSVARESPCVFTRGSENMYLPVAHGEGKLVALKDVLPQIHPVVYYADQNGSKTMRYPDNPNGSMDAIAGICDATGRIFGLMPHPERYISPTQNPRWTRLENREGWGDGFGIYRNAVAWAETT